MDHEKHYFQINVDIWSEYDLSERIETAYETTLTLSETLLKQEPSTIPSQLRRPFVMSSFLLALYAERWEENWSWAEILRFCKRKCPGADWEWCQSVSLLINQLYSHFRWEKKVVIEIIARAALKSCCGSFYSGEAGRDLLVFPHQVLCHQLVRLRVSEIHPGSLKLRFPNYVLKK